MESSGGFGARALNNMAFVGSAQLVRFFLAMLTTVVVGRLLSPADYGVFAMAGPVTGFILLFQDIGLGQATVQAQTLTQEKLNSAFWMNMLATSIIGAAFLLLAPFVAWFYQDWRPGYIVAASAIPTLIAGSAIQHNALLTRHMRFGLLSFMDVATAAIVCGATIAAAFALRTYWALWLGTLVGTALQAGFAWKYETWRPSRTTQLRGASQMARFGLNLTGSNVFNFFVRNLDNVLIARARGSGELGLYDRGYRLMMLPLENINAPVSRVMVPLLSRIIGEAERYRRAFLLATRGVLTVALPGIAVGAVLSEEIIPLLLGPKWQAAGRIFFWLSLMGLVQPLGNVTGWLFISSGRTKQLFRWSIFSSIVTATGFVIGVSRWGAVGVAASLFITSSGRLPLLLAYSRRETPVTTRDLWGVMVSPGCMAIAAAILTTLLRVWLNGWPLLIAALTSAYLAAALISLCTKDGRDLLNELRTHAKDRLPRFRRRALA